MDELTRDDIAYALKVARERGFRRAKVSLGDVVFSAKLGDLPEIEVEEMEDVAEEAPRSAVVAAPAVGFFRPGRNPVEVGQEVSVGDIVGEVIALGIANDVVSNVSGKVSELKVESGDAVEFGQVLVVLENP
ncbi:MAG: acetyl-CoA carboxylase biotin carboxyl carrier protein subunit [Armatimonadota bacterium]